MALIQQIASSSDITPGWLTNLSSVWPLQSVRSALGAAVATTIVHPLARLYLDGPTLLGFWGGASADSICSRLTGVDANFWSLSDDGREECEKVIQQHFNSWMVLASTIVYFVSAGMLVCVAYRKCKGKHPTTPTHQIVVLPPAYPPPYPSCPPCPPKD